MAGDIFERLWEVIEARGRERPQGSYVARLFNGGQPAIRAKLREELEELFEAVDLADADAQVCEAADLLFHLWVMLAHAGVSPPEVAAELERRFGVGGLIEKASRDEPGAG